VRRARFQVLADLDPEAREALRADIERHGVQVPIVRTKAGAIVDGHHRAQIAEELGIKCPAMTVDVDGKNATEMALRLNLLRRHLGPIAWADAFRRLAEVRGIRLGRGGDRRSQKGRSNDKVSLDRLAAEVGVNKHTAQRRLRLAETLADHPEIAAKVDRGEVDPKRAEELVRMATYERRRAKASPPPKVSLGKGIVIFAVEVVRHVRGCSCPAATFPPARTCKVD